MTTTATKPEIPADLQSGYTRVDLGRVAQGQSDVVSQAALAHPSLTAIRWAVIPLSALLCVVQAVMSVFCTDAREIILTSTLIPVIAFGVLFGLVLLLNPLLRALARVVGNWARPLNRVELVCLFAAMAVTAGISTFGLTEQLIPLLVTPNNPEWNVPQKGWNDKLVPSLNPHLYLQDPQVIKTFRQGVTHSADGTKLLPPKATATFGETLVYWGAVTRAIPWGAWIPPVGYWLIFVAACYGIFYCLTYVVLGYWSDREKLIFPLARLPEAMLPDAGRSRSWLPSLFHSPGFWLGFLLSFLILGWNGATTAGLLPGLSPIPLGMNAFGFNNIIGGSIFAGLSGKGDAATHFLIIFTAIGIGFLLPLEISFSVWFYFLVGRAIILIMVWSGRGKTANDFPTDWLWFNNPVTALGGGGIFLFSAMSLYRCIRDYARLVAGKSAGQRVLIGLPVVGLAACMGIVALWLAWNRMPLGWAFIFVSCLTLLTIGLMRIVAEGGIYWFQAHTSFFHVYKMLGLGRWLAPALLAPILPIYSVLFLDIKTFLAPSLLNAAEMQKSAGGNRFKFHANILICLALSVVASLGFAIIMAHIRGGQAMEGWFYNTATPLMMSTAQKAITDVPHFDPETTLWYAAGAIWVGISMFLRTTLFWFPHPVGFMMLISPLNTQLWFSFFIAWVCKKFVVKFGGKATFDRVRLIFIGLILGELMAIVFWTAMAFLNVHAGNITLNRYG